MTARSGRGAAGTNWTRPTLNTFRAKHVDKPPRTGPRRAPFVLLVVGLLVGGLCALLALNTAAAAAELRRQSLQNANAGLNATVQQLRTQLAARQAPGSLASAAAGLGMVPAGNPAFLKVQPDGTVTLLGSPAPASAPPAPPATTTPPAPPATPPSHPASRTPATGHPATGTPATGHPATGVPGHTTTPTGARPTGGQR